MDSLPTREYVPENFDQDGFIHCSTSDQVINVANRFYPKRKDLILLEIKEDKLAAKIIFENLEGGSELFPHLYGKLSHIGISRFARFVSSDDGFIFPEKWFSVDDIANMVK